MMIGLALGLSGGGIACVIGKVIYYWLKLSTVKKGARLVLTLGIVAVADIRGEGVAPILTFGACVLAIFLVDQLTHMTVEKVIAAAIITLTVGSAVGILLQYGVERDSIFNFARSSVGLGLMIMGSLLVIFPLLMCIGTGYSFSRGISPAGINSATLELCRSSEEVRQILGDRIKIQHSFLLEDGDVWKLWKFISTPFFRVLERCCWNLSPYFHYKSDRYRFLFNCGVFHGQSFVIIGNSKKGKVKWEAEARGVGKWVYRNITVDVKERGGSVKTIQVPVPEGEIIIDNRVIEVASN